MEQGSPLTALQVLWEEAVRRLGVHTVLLMAERIQWDLQAVYREADDIRFGPDGWELSALLARERGAEVAARIEESFLTLYTNLMGEAAAHHLRQRVQERLAGGSPGTRGA